MKLVLTFDRHTGAFVLSQLQDGVVLSAFETVDLFVLEKEIHLQLLRMRHLAQGKTFGSASSRSHA